MDPIRVLIADDHLFYREGIRALLLGVAEIEVVGEATTGDETIVQAEALQPDVILMDLKMPGLNGIEATRHILHTSPHIKVLVVTMFEDDDSVFATMRAGARGYLLKDADRDELARAVNAVSHGEAIFSPAIAQRMIRYFSALPHTASALAFPDLTEREREILQLIARGISNTIIAQRLTLSNDRAESCLQHLQQTPGGRPLPGDCASPRCRAHIASLRACFGKRDRPDICTKETRSGDCSPVALQKC